MAVAVLAVSAGLTDEFALYIGFSRERFFISDLRGADICFYMELTQQTVNNDLQMELAHSGNDRLSRFMVCIGAEGRILFSKLCQRDSDLLLSCLRLGLDRNVDNGLREDHGLQHDRAVLTAQGIACCSVLKSDGCRDISGVYFFQIRPVICMHHQDAAETLFPVLR